MRRPVCFVVLALLGCATSAEAQRLGSETLERPKLSASADTNDALAYLEHGMSVLEEQPARAAQAFYWAARLDPGSANAIYALRVAKLMRRPADLRNYMSGNRRARERADFRALDSLQLRALHLDPLLFRSLDRVMLLSYYFNNYRANGGGLTRRQFEMEIQLELASYQPATRAWLFYSLGQFAPAADEYQKAIDRARNPINLRIERARALAMQPNHALTLAEFTRALEALKARDERRGDYVVFYDSKALLEHSIGIIHTRAGDADAARAAFGRAMTEDLAYFPPHIELGNLALAEHDTITAVSELGLAAELAVDEPYVQYLYGSTLVSTGQHAEAVAPLRRAVELEPMYAAPYLALGEALLRTNDAAGARDALQRYLALAARRDAQGRQVAEARMSELAP